jgi:hypothetical protein
LQLGASWPRLREFDLRMGLWALVLLASAVLAPQLSSALQDCRSSQPLSRVGQPLFSTRLPEQRDVAAVDADTGCPGATPQAALRAQAVAAATSIQQALDEMHRPRSSAESAPENPWGLQDPESANNLALFQQEVENLGMRRPNPKPDTDTDTDTERSPVDGASAPTAPTAPLIRARGSKQAWKQQMRLQRHEELIRGAAFSFSPAEDPAEALGQAQTQTGTQQMQQTQQHGGGRPDPFTGGHFSLERLVAGELRLELLGKLRAARAMETASKAARQRETGRDKSTSSGSSSGGISSSRREEVRDDVFRLLSTLMQHSVEGGGSSASPSSASAWTFSSEEIIDE